MNVLTFDIEDWYLEKIFNGNRQEKYAEYDQCLDVILDILDQRTIKGTFFCTGGMVTDFPEVVRKIEKRGHEIGCHSFWHKRLDKLDKNEVKEDTRIAIDTLEQCIGHKVRSYRAPFFSVCQRNNWVFEILAEAGIERDTSVFPAKRDYGGYSQFKHKEPVLINNNGLLIKEFPINTISFMGKDIVYSGGGFFRFFPLEFIKRQMMKTNYTMTYLHISDFITRYQDVKTRKEYEEYYKESGTLFNRYKRYIKSSIGKKTALKKFSYLVESIHFNNMEQTDSMIDWNRQSVIVL